MHPLNDNNLDRLSREAADEFDVDLNTSGWEALEHRLNKELPLKEEKDRKRFLFWLFLFVLMAGSGLLWSMMHTKTNAVQMAGTEIGQEATGSTTQPATIKTPEATETTRTLNKDKALGTNVPITQGPVTNDPSMGASAPDKAAPYRNGGVRYKTNVPVGANDQSVRIKKKGTRSVSRPITGKRNDIASSDTSPEHSGLAKNVENNDVPTVNNDTANTVLARLRNTIAWSTTPKAGDEVRQEWARVVDSLFKTMPLTDHSDTTATAVTPKTKKDEKKNRGFEFGILVGPDMSNVKFTNTDNAGLNIGVQVGYRFSNRWSVNTGFIYTKKNYTVQGNDFTKTGWWQSSMVDLHSVDGYCKMFEIPLNLRYDIAVNKQRRWFVNAGASTYLMTNEYYTYDYTYGGSRNQRPYDYDSNSHYVLSILNISAGYERMLNKHFSIQAEPYFKFPMKGLGYGKLNLNSYGIYFSVKYRLSK